ncbi:cyclic nucleotide-binding domain-containing protein [Desulfosediminicola flagellatus]|uniref:cyclic nucleotide-binding domain-containing protein n=1 Tax=Desulfosediminicola flagellatus TaxID=2569541 RepID=UPI0010ACB52A|nr:cyclic nucleotide-binding domain-containing protein [Desulfosediminicola flagellatus]
MIEAARHQEFINTLKTFNNAAVSIRLYPANAPQITNAFERGYKAVKHHLRQHGNFTLRLRDEGPELCGVPLDLEVLKSISNLIVFRQLAHLQADLFQIDRGLDRKIFQKILDVFSAKVDLIKQQGGGRAYISGLGLDRYFPEEDESSLQPESADTSASAGTEEEGDVVSVTVRKEYIDVLLGRERRVGIVTELQTELSIPDRGASILATAIRGVLESLLKKKQFVTSSAFDMVLENCGKLIDAEKRQQLVMQTGEILLKNIDSRSAILLLGQTPEKESAKSLLISILQNISLEFFGEIIRELRKRAAQFRLTQNEDSTQVRFINSVTERLLATPKGKQYLGQEKAKSIMQAGEKTRLARRVQASVKSLMQGNKEVLKSEEFNVHLPFVLQKMEAEGLEKEVQAVLKRLTKNFLEGDAELRTRVIRSLSQVGENLAMEKRWNSLATIADPLLYWIRHSDNGDFIFEKICRVLQSLMGYSWTTGELKQGDAILSVFYQIRSGTAKKSEAVRTIIERTQDKNLDRALLSHLLEESLAKPKDEILSRRLILQGPIASRFLVDSLIRADKTEDRIKIIDLLTYGEQFLAPILVEKLDEPMPWYGKRNLLKLLAETGAPEHVDSVYPFLQHDDLRVQREAFACLYKISGKTRKKALLHALSEASETMKLQIVRALIPFADAEVTRGLSQLLEEHEFYSADFRDTLLSNVCLAIARCPYPDSEKVLLNFLEMQGKRGYKKIGTKVWSAAEAALKQAENSQLGERQFKAKVSQIRKSAISQAGVGQKASTEKKSITGLPEEKSIRKLLAADDTDVAKGMLLELIAKISRLRKFSQAEQLRDWLIDIDSMALTDIIKAAEIIEEEKHAAVDKGHLQIWSGLFDVLSTEEFSMFYHSLEHKLYANEEIIIKKGAKQTSLFFINSGRVKLFYNERDTEILIKTLQKGEILGVGTFFDASLWTLSAAALGQTNISMLPLDKVRAWQDDFPALESKLRDFCHRFESVNDIFKNSDKDRREYKRHKVTSQRVAITLLDKNGKTTGVSGKGDLFDFSRGGTSFYMRISKRDNARLLLGRGLKVTLPIEETSGTPVSFIGDIVAVKAHHAMEYEYSVHIEFNTPLGNSQMQQVLRLL